MYLSVRAADVRAGLDCTQHHIVLLCAVSLFYDGIEVSNIHHRNVSDVQLDNNDVKPRNQVLTSAGARCFLS